MDELLFTHLNPDSGDVGTLEISNAPCPHSQGQISPDLTKIVVTIGAGSDGSKHVGWADLDTGAITDVTAKVEAAGGAMSARPQHADPTFSPQGEFVYTDQLSHTMKFIDPISFKKVRELDEEPGGNYYFSRDGTQVSAHGYGGTVASAEEILGAEGSKYCYSMGDVLPIFPGDGTVIAVDDKRLAILSDTGTDVGSGCHSTSPVRYLSPESDYGIVALVYRPSTKQVYFSATRGKENVLFSVPMDGSTAPVEILDLKGLRSVRTTGSLEGLGSVSVQPIGVKS